VRHVMHRDQLSSTVMITDANADWGVERAYAPFGTDKEWNNASAVDPLPEDIGFIGERKDAVSGLHYLNARYYDPKLRMFIQPDWIEVTEPGVGTNRYAYSGNDPVNLWDHRGNVGLFAGGAGDRAKDGSLIGNFRDNLMDSEYGKSLESPNDLSPELFTHRDTRQHYENPSRSKQAEKGLSNLAQHVVDIKDQHPEEPISLFGHSWGAVGIISVTNELNELGIVVDTVVTLDPVSRVEKSNMQLDNPSTRHLNFFVPDASRFSGLGRNQMADFIAKVGKPVGPIPGADNFAVIDWEGRGIGQAGHSGIVTDRDLIGSLLGLLD